MDDSFVSGVATENFLNRLRYTEQYAVALMENANDAIFVVSLDGKILCANRQAEEALGFSKSELVGRFYYEFPVPEDVDHATREVGKVNEGKEVAPTAVRLRRQDGGIILMEFSATMIELDGEQVMMSIGRDVTEAKKAEELMRQQQEQLLQAQKMEVIGRLAGGVAHDFNNILSVISGNCEWILSELKEGQPFREELEEIHKAVTRGADLTRQLLLFSRKQVVQPRALDLGVLMGDLKKSLARMIGENMELDVRTGDPVGTILADPLQIQQILMNLVINSCDAMPQGGSIIIETGKFVLNEPNGISANGKRIPAGSYARLSIKDTGTGMDAETQKHIFEPFFTTKAVGKGTGLGLATVFGITEQLGGFIQVHSEVGKGTTFEILIPVRKAA